MTRKQETKTANTLSNKEQALIDAYWRAAIGEADFPRLQARQPVDRVQMNGCESCVLATG